MVAATYEEMRREVDISPARVKLELVGHGIPTQTIDGVLWALDSYTMNGTPMEDWISTESWTRKDMFRWLGY